MALGEIVVEIVGGALRLLVQFFLEIVLEILLKKPGYLICRKFAKDVDPDGVAVVFIGFIFWAFILSCGYMLYTL